MPSRGHCSIAALKASCNASSARSKSRAAGSASRKHGAIRCGRACRFRHVLALIIGENVGVNADIVFPNRSASGKHAEREVDYRSSTSGCGQAHGIARLPAKFGVDRHFVRVVGHLQLERLARAGDVIYLGPLFPSLPSTATKYISISPLPLASSLPRYSPAKRCLTKS